MTPFGNPFSRRACPPRSSVGQSGGHARRLNGVLLAVLLVTLAGCCNCPPPAQPHAYVGPTEPVDVVVARINRNAARVPSLWSQLDYRASFVDPRNKGTTDVSGDGLLVYRRPASMVLTGDKDIAGQVFQLGCDGEQFWVKVRTAVDAADYYWGHLANVGKPCCRPVPIRPDLVTQVLGVGLLQTNLLEQPTPVMRFDNDADCYVFDFNVRRPDRWVTQKEVWYDRASAYPKRVVLYDDAGRAVVRAELSQHRAVEEAGNVPADQRPVVARHYELRFPDTGSTMSLDLNNPALTHRVRRLTFPNDAAFRRTPPDGNDKVIQVDAGCGDGGPI